MFFVCLFLSAQLSSLIYISNVLMGTIMGTVISHMYSVLSVNFIYGVIELFSVKAIYYIYAAITNKTYRAFNIKYRAFHI